MHLLDRFERDALPVAAAFVGLLRSGMIDQDPPHRYRGSGEEMPPALPVRFGVANQSDIRLVDERCRLKRMVARFRFHALCGQLAQLIINKRKKPIRGTGVTLFDGVEKACHFIHEIKATLWPGASEAFSDAKKNQQICAHVIGTRWGVRGRKSEVHSEVD